METINICALVVTFFPTEGNIENLRNISDQVDKIVVVDNGSDLETQSKLLALESNMKIKIIVNRENLGLAAAMNQGIIWAGLEGFEWILTLDQDSTLAPGMVLAMITEINDQREIDKVAIIAPIIVDQENIHEAMYLRSRIGPLYERVSCDGATIENVSIVVTSGCLLNILAFRGIGKFQEDFFIDYVDTEYCLRALLKGFRITVVCKAVLFHSIGSRRKRSIGPFSFFPTFHTPKRWYYISRNRIPMLRMYALKFPHWLSFEIVSSIYIFFRMLMFEDRRWQKVKAVFYGTLDGVRRSMGPILEEVAAKLTAD